MKNNLKTLRIKHRYSQEYVARKANISLRHYQKIENGESIPTLTVAINICQVFNLNIYDVFIFD